MSGKFGSKMTTGFGDIVVTDTLTHTATHTQLKTEIASHYMAGDQKQNLY